MRQWVETKSLLPVTYNDPLQIPSILSAQHCITHLVSQDKSRQKARRNAYIFKTQRTKTAMDYTIRETEMSMESLSSL
jgi:hypothetical protein